MQGDPLAKIRSIADYQFGRGAGSIIFPDGAKISLSQRTKRIKHIRLDGELLATLRPTNGLFSLTVEGACRLMTMKPRRFWVQVSVEAANFVKHGRSVFAKHVVDCDEQIRPKEEVAAIDAEGKVLAVGRAVLTGEEMKAFARGVAVQVRRGASERAERVKKES